MAPASQLTAGTAKPAIQVQIRQDQDAAFLRGEVVSEFAVVELDISTLTPDQRAQLLKHKGYDGVFKIGDKMDQPTAEKLTALLQSKADSAKAAEQEQIARDIKNATEYAARIEERITQISQKKPSSINASSLKICEKSEGRYEVMAYPLYTGFIGWKPGVSCDEARAIMATAEAKLKDVMVLLQAENADIEKAESEKAKAFYENEEAKRKAAAELAKIAADSKAADDNAERLRTGAFGRYFEDYSESRYGRPWGATVRLVNGRLEYNFNDGRYENNHVIIPCKPGEIVACGQKDKRGSKTQNYLFVMEEDGSMRQIERGEARELLANPIPKGYLAKPEEFADA